MEIRARREHRIALGIFPNILDGVPNNFLKKPISVTHPELAKEADGWDPTQVTRGSNKKLSWKCQEGHSWQSPPNKRAGRGDSCPYCSGKRVLAGFNDLATTHPEIASQANRWDPKTVSAGSNKKVEWICSKNHLWQTTISHRTGKKATGCPICSGYKTVAGINDLVTLFPEIAIEADGWNPVGISSGSNKKTNWRCAEGHVWKAVISSRTKQKTGCPICSNLRIVPGINDLQTLYPEVALDADGWNPETVGIGSSKKMNWKCKSGHTYIAQINKRTLRNQGCPTCANKRLVLGLNDLLTTHPEIASEAFGWDPASVNAGRGSKKSSEKKLWKCKQGHTWRATPASRTNKNHSSGCPICSGNTVLKGFNDLATTHPELASEAFGWDPTIVVASGRTKVKWKCEKGHVWSQRITERKSGSGCPSCAKAGFDPNKEGWIYFLFHPSWLMFQIGITNVPDNRLASHKRLGWEILEVRGAMEGHLAQAWERDILRMLRARGADLSNRLIAGNFDGYSEAWSKSTFDVDSISELMRITQEFEEQTK